MDQVNFEMMLPLNGYSGKFRSESTGKRGIMKFFQSCIATLKPIASLLITVPIVICYICLGAVVFLYFGSPIQWQNRSKLPQKVQVIEAFYFGRIYNSTHTGNFSQVQMEISSLIKSLTSAFISNANFFNDASTYSNGNWTFVPAALQSLCLITAIGTNLIYSS